MKVLTHRSMLGGAIAALLVSTSVMPARAGDVGLEENVVERPSDSVTADALPTVQMNGVAWDQAISGDVVYVGGQFTKARPAGSQPGQNEVARENILAYDIKTGELVDSFAPTINGRVSTLSMSPSGDRLYVGGHFTEINGEARYRVAALDPATGELVANFAPGVDAAVTALVATDETVYIGGAFSSVNGVERTRLAAVKVEGARTRLDWAPRADGLSSDMVLTPDGSRVVVAGKFGTISGKTARGTVSLDAQTGQVYPFAINNEVINNGLYSGVTALKNDGDNILGVAYKKVLDKDQVNGQAFYEGSFSVDAMSGEVNWLADCHGDSYDVVAMGKTVYVASHAHGCENINGFPEQDPNRYFRAHAVTNYATTTVASNTHGNYSDHGGQPAPSLVGWFPTLDAGSYTGTNQAAWSAEATDEYLVLAGEFPRVNGVPQQGLVRFAVNDLAPNESGSVERSFAAPQLVASSDSVEVIWDAMPDRDDLALTYSVYRDGQLVTTQRRGTLPWLTQPRASLAYTDSDLEQGREYGYYVVVSDDDGNRLTSATATAVTGETTQTPASYPDLVQQGSPVHYWRLEDESLDAGLVDTAQSQELAANAGVTLQRPGVLPGSDDKSARFAKKGGFARTTDAESASANYSAELWFKTGTKAGGALLTFADQPTSKAQNVARALYLGSDQRLHYSSPKGIAHLESPVAVNDSSWHHVVITAEDSATSMYLDGTLVDTTSGETVPAYQGHWHVGSSTLKDLPALPDRRSISANIDEIAIYPSALNAQTIAAHYDAGSGEAG